VRTLNIVQAIVGFAGRIDEIEILPRTCAVAAARSSLAGRLSSGCRSAGGDTLSGTFDILAILRYLKSLGIITGNEYLSGWELGVETISGSGSMTVNQLSYTWN
jgi:hypothetical protein